jgi:phage-related holin
MNDFNESQKEVILELDSAMKNLFMVFVKVDKEGIPITDALEAIGMDVPLFAKPAVNQLSGRLREMSKEKLEEEISA